MDDLSFPVVSRVAGVANASGNISFAEANGVTVKPDAANGTITFGLGPLVQTTGVLEACRGPCDPHSVPEGMVIAEGSLISFNNVSLNAAGPEADSAVFFYDGGQQTGQFVRWSDARNEFQTSSGLQALGEIAAIGGVGTVTVLPPTTDQPTAIELHTAAIEGLESAVFIRGSSKLQNGTATIQFPPAFTKLIGEGPITAQVTLTSVGPGLYVSEKAKDHIKVQTTTGEASSATFDLFVQATRAGGENYQSVRQP
jgi:hypothetical protein